MTRLLSRLRLRSQLVLLAVLCGILVVAPLILAFAAWTSIAAVQNRQDDAQRLDLLVRDARARQEAWLRLGMAADAQAVGDALAAAGTVVGVGRIDGATAREARDKLDAYRNGFAALKSARDDEMKLERDFTASTLKVGDQVARMLSDMEKLRGRLQTEGEDFGSNEMGVLTNIQVANLWVSRLSALWQRYLRSEDLALLDAFARGVERKSDLGKAIDGLSLSAGVVKGIDLPPLVKAFKIEVEDWARKPQQAKDCLAARRAAAMAADEAGTAIGALAKRATDGAVKAVARTQATAALLWVSLCLAGLALFILVAAGVMRAITGRLGKAVALAERMGGGDLTVRLDPGVADEVGRMAEALNRSVDGMAGAVRTIAGQAGQLERESAGITALSQRLDGSAKDTAHRAQGASAAAQEVAASMNTLASSVQQLDASVGEIASAAQQSAATAAEGTRAATSAAEGMQRLARTSEQIGGILQLITGIAEQVNLLSLNAAIEAASAGEAGRGFAVVAGEVKALAQRTQDAAGEVAKLVAAIQTDVSSNSQAITTVAGLMAKVDEMQHSTAAAVEEQAATTREMGVAVSQAAEAAKDIAANATAVADAAAATGEAATQAQRAAAELARMSTALNEAVGRFKA
jgi:methyl-accepting chemotaxis protein